MPTTVSLFKVTKEEAPSTRVLIEFASGQGFVFNNINDARNWATVVDFDLELTQRLCLAYAFARSNDLSNIATVQNKDFIFNLSNPNPIRVQ